ncbi:MAG: D-alanyl-D-alanine carboxypeptidase family protein [Actinomycetota bacterium]
MAGGSKQPQRRPPDDEPDFWSEVPTRRIPVRVGGFLLLAGLFLLAGVLPGSAQTTSTTAPTTTAAPSSTEAPTTTAAPTTEAPTTTAAPTTEAPTTTAAPSSTAAPTTASTDGSTSTTAPGSSTSSDADLERVEEAESSKAREIDAANARLSDLNQALADLEGDIEAKAAEVEIANRRLAAAQAAASGTQEEVTELERQVLELQESLGDQAIESYKGETIDEAVLVGTDPGRAMRMQTLLAKATRSDIDYANLLTAVREDLLASRRDVEAAIAEADESRAAGEKQLAELEADKDSYGQLLSAADDRVDHLLAERAALAQLGAEVEAGAQVDIDEELVARLAAAPRAPSSGSSATPIPVADGEIVSAGNGIMVHESIVADVRQLLADAAADGVILAGGGYRDPAGQIAVRRNNCGTSNYAIYEMPSSQCSPPTARPGRSMHEQGRAIDFTYNGRIIGSRSGAAWNWLATNAERYGLYNLPSEPWHWSTNGR